MSTVHDHYSYIVCRYITLSVYKSWFSNVYFQRSMQLRWAFLGAFAAVWSVVSADVVLSGMATVLLLCAKHTAILCTYIVTTCIIYFGALVQECLDNYPLYRACALILLSKQRQEKRVGELEHSFQWISLRMRYPLFKQRQKYYVGELEHSFLVNQTGHALSSFQTAPELLCKWTLYFV